ncbi:hypothetical protein MOE96_15985 [Bacillus inaquosorum]|uniref:hypothetical protein n=1 Tax=Bacillus inaquosorum TaxID=483913 RepID=UPI00227F927D|nr:hypothetical protein [Bacillus inaquosorum]MCY9096374.1 hypothetical protein [Bacillus inaquosorum]
MSKLENDLIGIFKLFSKDAELLRLAYYKDLDDPNNIDVQQREDYYEILKEIIVRAPKFNDLKQDNPQCRICMYFGNGYSTNNLRVSTQDVMIDVYTHIEEFEENDPRSLKIIDRLSDIVFNKNVAGVGKVANIKRMLIGNPPDGYIGYKLIFSFGAPQ